MRVRRTYLLDKLASWGFSVYDVYADWNAKQSNLYLYNIIVGVVYKARIILYYGFHPLLTKPKLWTNGYIINHSSEKKIHFNRIDYSKLENWVTNIKTEIMNCNLEMEKIEIGNDFDKA